MPGAGPAVPRSDEALQLPEPRRVAGHSARRDVRRLGRQVSDARRRDLHRNSPHGQRGALHGGRPRECDRLRAAGRSRRRAVRADLGVHIAGPRGGADDRDRPGRGYVLRAHNRHRSRRPRGPGGRHDAHRAGESRGRFCHVSRPGRAEQQRRLHPPRPRVRRDGRRRAAGHEPRHRHGRAGDRRHAKRHATGRDEPELREQDLVRRVARPVAGPAPHAREPGLRGLAARRRRGPRFPQGAADRRPGRPPGGLGQ